MLPVTPSQTLGGQPIVAAASGSKVAAGVNTELIASYFDQENGPYISNTLANRLTPSLISCRVTAV